MSKQVGKTCPDSFPSHSFVVNAQKVVKTQVAYMKTMSFEVRYDFRSSREKRSVRDNAIIGREAKTLFKFVPSKGMFRNGIQILDVTSTSAIQQIDDVVFINCRVQN